MAKIKMFFLKKTAISKLKTSYLRIPTTVSIREKKCIHIVGDQKEKKESKQKNGNQTNRNQRWRLASNPGKGLY